MKLRKESDWGPRKYKPERDPIIPKDLPQFNLDECEIGDDGKRRKPGEIVERDGVWVIILVVGWRPLNRFEYWWCVTLKEDRAILPIEPFDDTEEMNYAAGVIGEIPGEDGFKPPKGDDDADPEEE